MRESAVRPGDMMAVELSRLIHNGDRVFHGVSSHLPMIARLSSTLHAVKTSSRIRSTAAASTLFICLSSIFTLFFGRPF